MNDEPDALPTEPAPVDDRDVTDAATPEGVRAQGKRRRSGAERSGDFWRAVLNDETGRAEVWKLLVDGGCFSSALGASGNGGAQPELSWILAGKRDLVLGLFNRLLAIDLDGVRLMLNENDTQFKALVNDSRAR